MTGYESRWYRCALEDSSIDKPEPAWGRVPEAKREMVRAKWIAANQQTVTSEVMLWGPQIPFFARQPYYRVEVLGD